MPDALIASLAEGIAVCDRELRLTAWNRRLEELTGIPAERVVGRPLSEALPALWRRGTGALIDRVLRGETVRLPDLPFRHGGRRGWLSARCAPFRNPSGHVMGAAAVVHEITERRRAEMGLLRSEAQLRAIFQGAAVGIALVDGGGRVVAANPALELMLGHPVGALAGRPAAELLHPDDPTDDPWAFADGDGAGRPRERRLLRRDGSILWGRITALPVPGPAGEPWLGLGMVEDLTVLHHAEEENHRLAALLRESPTPTLACDAEGRVAFRNRAAERLFARFGADGEARLLPAEHPRLVRTALESGRSLRAVEVEAEEWVFSWTYHPHPGLGAVHLFAQDVTERRASDAQLRHGALHDDLTGLPNRLLFMERLARAVVATRRDPERRFAVLFLDLDRFKVVNDGLGHAVGDQLLAAVAARIRASLREGDTAARFGGDEFALLLDPIDGPADAVRAAQRVQAAVAAPVELDGYEMFTSASVGIALSASAHGRPENLLRNADMAMYRAKARGTGHHAVFDHAMHAAALVRLQTETDLRHGLERGEFRLAWQPVVETVGGRIAGVEALLRWAHPERGTVGPGAFIPLAEETGLIHPLGRWALREACRQTREWRESVPEAAELEVSVNVSPRQFAQPGLVEQVADVLEETGLPAAAVRLEVTESAMLDDADAAMHTLERLKALGLRIHLDDFGTGYSSLALLHRLPIDALKVDRSFVMRIGADPDALQLVRTVAALARGLGMDVVAEGVETPEQLAELRELGVEHVQGFFFAAPLGARGMRALLRDGLRG